MDNIGSVSVRFGPMCRTDNFGDGVGPDRLKNELGPHRTEPRPIQKQRRPTDRSGPWMTIGPDRTDAHINLGRDMRCSLRLSLKCHKQSSVMLHTQNEVKFEDYIDDVA